MLRTLVGRLHLAVAAAKVSSPAKTNFRGLCISSLRLDSDGGRPPVHVIDPDTEPAIPPYTERPSEPATEKRARLLYQSRKRGILENGLLLATFAHKYLDQFSDEQLRLYDRLINLPSNDWEIYYWATGVRPIPAEFDNEIMRMLKEHTKNKNRESRYNLPSLKETA